MQLNLLLDFCRDIDNKLENINIREVERNALNDEWEIASLELDNTDRRLHEHGKNIVTMIKSC